jgi:phosphoglycerate kinase
MEKEIKGLEDILHVMAISKYDTFVLGGAKPEDPLNILDHMFKTRVLEKALTCGVLGLLFLKAKGFELGSTDQFLQAKGYIDFLPRAKRLWKRYPQRIEIPIDVAVEVEGKRAEMLVEDLPIASQILDIGKRTIEKYVSIIKESVVVGMKGPAGVYERKGFEVGTRALLKTMATTNVISLIGGGHTLDALAKLGIEKRNFTHVSLGGGALIIYLSGKPLPAIEALEKA